MLRGKQNGLMVRKLAIIVIGMFAFGYGLVPLYRAICEVTGINILSLTELTVPGSKQRSPKNTQVDTSRTITVEFDTNTRGLWQFHPAVRSMQVHPGEMATVMYEFENSQARTMAAQASPSYAPKVSAAYFNKLECFCFTQYTLAPAEKKSWPVVFIVDPKLPKDVTTITLSYTFFEVGGRTPAAPTAAVTPQAIQDDGLVPEVATL